MPTPLNVFVTESNIDIYLSRLRDTLDAGERDVLLRLIAAEEARMGLSREHLEIGEKRAIDGRHRLEQQRLRVAEIPQHKRIDHPSVFILETLEKTQQMLEEHLEALRKLHKQTRP